jgi:hypothetical protein
MYIITYKCSTNIIQLGTDYRRWKGRKSAGSSIPGLFRNRDRSFIIDSLNEAQRKCTIHDQIFCKDRNDPGYSRISVFMTQAHRKTYTTVDGNYTLHATRHTTFTTLSRSNKPSGKSSFVRRPKRPLSLGLKSTEETSPGALNQLRNCTDSIERSK